MSSKKSNSMIEKKRHSSSTSPRVDAGKPTHLGLVSDASLDEMIHFFSNFPRIIWNRDHDHLFIISLKGNAQEQTDNSFSARFTVFALTHWLCSHLPAEKKTVLRDTQTKNLIRKNSLIDEYCKTWKAITAIRHSNLKSSQFGWETILVIPARTRR